MEQGKHFCVSFYTGLRPYLVNGKRAKDPIGPFTYEIARELATYVNNKGPRLAFAREKIAVVSQLKEEA